MGSEAEEFEGWELLHDSSDSESGIILSVGSGENISDDNISAHSGEMNSDDVAAAQSIRVKESDDIDAQSGGMIQANYFSIDAQDRGMVTGADMSEDGSENSDNPSWIDPSSEHRYPRKEFWSDSGSERSDERRVNELEGGHEVVLACSEKQELGSQGTKEISGGDGKTVDKVEHFSLNSGSVVLFDDQKVNQFESGSEMFLIGNKKGIEGSKEISGGGEEILEKIEQFCSDSRGIEMDSVKVADFGENIGTSITNANLEVPLPTIEKEEEEEEKESDKKERELIEVEPRKRKGEVEKKSTIVWWKVPMQFLKHCVFKASPIWSLPVVAAVLGLVILGRRLSKMKKKTLALDIKVTMEDKKLSQIVNRAGRLNEAFSVVKRVPVIRPWLPSTGVAQWPAMSLR